MNTPTFHYAITMSTLGSSSSSDLSSSVLDSIGTSLSSESSLCWQETTPSVISNAEIVLKKQTIAEAALAWLQGRNPEESDDDDDESSSVMEESMIFPLWNCSHSQAHGVAHHPETTFWDRLSVSSSSSSSSSDGAMEIELKYDETILQTGYPLIRA